MEKHLQKKGWSKMRLILDKEMPVSKRKPFLAWWVGGTSVAACIILIFQIWPVTESRIKQEETVNSNSGSISKKNAESTVNASSETGISSNTYSHQPKLSTEKISTEKTVNFSELNSNIGPYDQLVGKSNQIDNSKNDLSLETASFVKVDQLSPVSVNAPIHLFHSGDLDDTLILYIDNTPDNLSNLSNSIDNHPNRTFNTIPSEAVITFLGSETSQNGLKIEQGIDSKTRSETPESIKNLPNQSSFNNTRLNPIQGYVGASSGMNIVDPVSYVTQFRGGLQCRLANQWDAIFGVGIGVTGLSHKATVGLLDEAHRLDSYDNSNSNQNAGQSLPNGTEAADLELRNNLFTYLETGIQYRYRNVYFGAGLEFAYRFGIQSQISQSALDANAMSPQRNFTGAEIEELFTLYNLFDFRPMLRTGYKLSEQFFVELVYAHGLNPLIRFPILGSKPAFNRNIQLGIGYQF